MDKKAIDKISQSVYRQFPEFKGQRPKIDRNYGSQSKAAGKPDTHLLIFSTVAKNAAGKSIPRHVRVVADDSGKIIKISTSR